jgi:hypothetical protein
LTNAIYYQLCRLPVLKYCKLSLKANAESNPLPIATTKFSPVEYLTIVDHIYINEVNVLLSYFPQIRRLFIRDLYKSPTTELHFNMVSHLTHVSLNITDVTFDEFELLMKTLFQQIQVLYISTREDRDYIDANRWQELILSHLSNLRIFDLQHKYSFKESERPVYDNLLNKFKSLFWFKRKWFFEHHIYHDENDDLAIFFSTNPYRYVIDSFIYHTNFTFKTKTSHIM